MYGFTVLLVVGCALGAYALPPRIVGGNDAPLGKYPYQVSLRQYGSHFCGGSILNKRYILTAAHCVVNIWNAKVVKVHAGTNFLNQLGDAYGVQEIISHKQYNPSALVNDIALLYLSEDIQFTEVVQPVEFAKSADFATAGDACVVSGWGTTRLGGRPPNKLQELALLVQSQEQCRSVHSGVKDSHICTFIKYGMGLCHGDSGGPLVANGVQIGIVSYGRPCAVGYPDVFTRVGYFKDWIQDNMKNL